jgi:membrane protease YdiL (CAAX protease family)
LNFDGLAFGLTFGLFVSATMLGLYFGWLRGSSLLRHTPDQLRAKVEDFGAATPLSFILLGSFISIFHSLLEEYYWRWFVFGELRQLIPATVAIVVSGLAFMGHHVVVLDVYFPRRFFAAVLFSLGIGVGGMVWAWLYQRTGSILVTWLSHLLVDAAIIVIGYDMLFA